MGMIGIPLVEHDPDLFASLEESAMQDAREAIVPAWQVDAGAWSPPSIDPARAPFGLLLLDGFISRETTLSDAASVELLGPGDVMRPWVGVADTFDIEASVSWEALETCVIAALDVRFGSVALRHPAIIATLMDRYIMRARWLSLQLAVCHIVGLDKRLETMLWHLAERWGRVSTEGIVLPLRFSHEFLAKLVGVRRPSVTSAISRLRHEGVVERRADGSWLLHGSPPAELAEIQAGALASPA
jgi:CRP/FNR family transcriptional regulator, cyclic AMP receptor protein